MTGLLRKRLFPLLATAALIVIGMTVTVVGPHLIGRTGWSVSVDLWGTLAAAQRLVHLNLAGLYAKPTGLITFPGAAVILAPAVALADAAHLSLSQPGPHNTQPAVWLVAGPVHDRAFGGGALCRRRSRRAPACEPVEARLPGRRECGRASERLGGMGPPGGRRCGGAGAVCHLGAVRCAAGPGRVADRGGDRGAAARPVGVARHAGARRAQAARPAFWPRRRPPPRCCSVPRLPPTGTPPIRR